MTDKLMRAFMVSPENAAFVASLKAPRCTRAITPADGITDDSGLEVYTADSCGLELPCPIHDGQKQAHCPVVIADGLVEADGQAHPAVPCGLELPCPIHDAGQEPPCLPEERTRIAYLAHPLAQTNPTQPDPRRNLERARAWLAKLLEWYPERAFVAPWIPYAEVLAETPGNRTRGLRDDLVVLERCDELWLVGARISAGMAQELACALRCGHAVYDLTGTALPPEHAPAALLALARGRGRAHGGAA